MFRSCACFSIRRTAGKNERMGCGRMPKRYGCGPGLTRALPGVLVQSAENNALAVHSLSEEIALGSRSMLHRLTSPPSSVSAERRPARHAVGRRMFCLCCLSVPGLLRATAARAGLSPDTIVPTILAEAANSPIRVHRLRGGVAVLEGSGGNVAVLPGPEGKLLVDAGIAVSRPQLETALNDLGEGPVSRLINTHWHFDHADGNAWLHQAGAQITAHANTRKRLSEVQRVADWNYDFPPLPAGALPSDVFTTGQTLNHGGVTIELRYYGPAHTDSDISVRFTDADILHAGDSYWNGAYPMIDYSTGGHIDGAIAAAEANLRTTTDSTIVIPGHGHPVSDRAGLQAFRDMLVEVRAKVAVLKRQGQSLEAITAVRPTAMWDAEWGNFVISPALFTKLVYEGV